MVTMSHPSAKFSLSKQVSISWTVAQSPRCETPKSTVLQFSVALPVPGCFSVKAQGSPLWRTESLAQWLSHNTQAIECPSMQKHQSGFWTQQVKPWNKEPQGNLELQLHWGNTPWNRNRLWSPEFVKEVKINKQLKWPLQKNRWILLRLFGLCYFTHDIGVQNKYLLSKEVRANNLNLRFKGWGQNVRPHFEETACPKRH